MFRVEHMDHFFQAIASGVTGVADVAVAMRTGCPARTPSPMKSPSFELCDDGLLAGLGDYGELY